MQVAYPACFLAMAGEAWVRGSAMNRVALVGVAVFACAKALKYWAIATLGERWTFRVLVPRGSHAHRREDPTACCAIRTTSAVAGRVSGIRAGRTGADRWRCGVRASSDALMLARIRVEESALRNRRVA